MPDCGPTYICLTVRRRPGHRAIGAIRTRSDLRRLLATRVALVPITALSIILASIGDLESIAVVGVDATENTAIDSHRILDNDVAGPAVARAVTAAANDLAIVLSEEVLDAHRASTVELEDLVGGLESTAAIDVRGAGGLLERRGILADIFPPDVVERAMGYQNRRFVKRS